MRTRYVWLICGFAIAVVEVLTAVAIRGRLVSADALHSLSYTLYLVAGIGAGRLEASGRLARAVRAGCLAGAITGFVGGVIGQGMRWALGIEVAHTAPLVLAARATFVVVITVLTAATMGLLGGIAGWGVRRAVEPVA